MAVGIELLLLVLSGLMCVIVAASLDGTQSEGEALSALEKLDLTDLRVLPFKDVELLVHRGWWSAARLTVKRSHGAKVDFTPAVRRATSDVKKEADELLRWLDPRFAHPEPTPMAIRWAQNATALMIAARFAPQWDAPGAKIAVFSTEHGKGHVDKDRTAARVREMLKVSINSTSMEAEITAEAGNARKRYTLALGFFDEIVPERSHWAVEFQRAQGSMQMSKGAQIPELQILLRKQWPWVRPWPRVTVATKDEGGAEPLWWLNAPGVDGSSTELLRSNAPLTVSSMLCSQQGRGAYCRASDSCVGDCMAECERAALHSTKRRCVAAPSASSVEGVEFVDEDLLPDQFGGSVHLRIAEKFVDSAESFVLSWGSSASEHVPVEPLSLTRAYADLEVQLAVPVGTQAPPGGTHLLVSAVNEAGDALIAAVLVQDRVKPLPVNALVFVDEDPGPGKVRGTAKITPNPADNMAREYEVWFGREAKGGAEIFGESAVARASVGGEQPVLALDAQLPHGATRLVAFAVGDGSVLSEPFEIQLHDARPPTRAPTGLRIGSDTNGKAGLISLTVSVVSAVCHKAIPANRAKSNEPCDIGDSHVVYWAFPNNTRHGSAIIKFPLGQNSVELLDLAVPVGITSLRVFAANAYGETENGYSARFSDNKKESLASWRDVWIYGGLGGGMGGILRWNPFAWSPDSAVTGPDSVAKFTITAVALHEGSRLVLAGRSDGSIVVLDFDVQEVAPAVRGSGSVSSLSFDGSGMRAARGAKGGALDLWDLRTGAVTLHMKGHTNDVAAVDVDWVGSWSRSQRVVSASLDGTVRIWDMKSGACISTLTGHEGGVHHLVVDWTSGRILSVSSDETLVLWSSATSDRLLTLEGHSDAVRFAAVDWRDMLALSVADGGVAKLWDLGARACLATFALPSDAPISAVRTDWPAAQALVVQEDGTAILLDLRSADGPHEIATLKRPLAPAAVVSRPDA